MLPLYGQLLHQQEITALYVLQLPSHLTLIFNIYMLDETKLLLLLIHLKLYASRIRQKSQRPTHSLHSHTKHTIPYQEKKNKLHPTTTNTPHIT